MVITGMVLGSKRAPVLHGAPDAKTRAGGPSVGKWCHGAPLFPPAPGIFGAFLTALGGLCSLPEHSYGKETADELEEHTGRSQPHGGTVSMGLFAWKYP